MSIIQSGNRFSSTDITATYQTLPQGNYILKRDPRSGEYYLNKKESFVMPSKVYGDHSIVDRWLKSWKINSSKNLGILLSGVKGSGKTITAQKFCMDSELPVIMINEPFEGTDFVDFITDPKLGECIIFIDEFEKIYNRDNQHDMLSLMDGNYNTKLIFLLTVNEERINDYLINRLNRIKYRKMYGDLEFEIMEEVIEDMLVNKEHKPSIYEFFEKVNMRTFDLLTNLIKEMNLFNEDAIQCGMHLNLRPEDKSFEVYEIFNGDEYPCGQISWAPDDDTIEIHRRSLDYIPQSTDTRSRLKASFDREDEIYGLTSGDEVSKANYDKYYKWYVELELEECEVNRFGKMINIKHPKSGLEFNLKESKIKYSLVF